MWLINHADYNYVYKHDSYLLQTISRKLRPKKLHRMYANWNQQATKFPNFIRLLVIYRTYKKNIRKTFKLYLFKKVNEALNTIRNCVDYKTIKLETLKQVRLSHYYLMIVA